MMFFNGKTTVTAALFIFAALGLGAGCNIVKKESKTAVVLKNETATQAQLMAEVNRFARVDSLNAKVDLKFEDTSYGEFGLKESYRNAPGQITVQRPAMILLKLQVPVFGSDIARMTSDGEHFRVAILADNASGKLKKFLKGTNSADYSILEKTLT